MTLGLGIIITRKSFVELVVSRGVFNVLGVIYTKGE